MDLIFVLLRNGIGVVRTGSSEGIIGKGQLITSVTGFGRIIG